MFRDNPSKRGKDYREFVDQSREDVSRLAQFRVILSAEKRAGKPGFLVEVYTDRMSQRRFANSRCAVDPVCIVFILLPRFIGRPAYDLFEEKFAGAFHTLAIPVIPSLDIFKSLKQKFMLYTKLLRMKYGEMDTKRPHQYP